jgi:L-asparagine transporter-like permease
MWFFPWASYAAVAGMAAILIAMALTPGELAQELRVSVLALALAVGAYLTVRARRRALGLTAGVAGSQAGH